MTWTPHPKQKAFIDSVLGTECYENWFLGANRGGKSDALTYCIAKLSRFGLPNPKTSFCGDGLEVLDRATSGWVLSQDFPSSRDIIQPKIFHNGFGSPGAHVPFIPDREIAKWDRQDQILKLKNGSIIGFKSCDSKTIKFAGADKDWVAIDEETPKNIYDEITMRIGAGRRLRIFGAATLIPEADGRKNKGVSWMFKEIIKPFKAGTRPNTKVFSLSIYDNPHLSREELAVLESKFPPGTLTHKIRILGDLVDEFAGVRAYSMFSSKIHVKPQEYILTAPLVWTWDFNVEPLVSLICQYTGGIRRVLKELIVDIGSTFDMVSLFKRTIPLHGNEVWVYGDASGRKRTDQTAKSTYTLIQELMQDYPVPVIVKVPESNPSDIHRVNSINRLLKAPLNGEVGLQIDPSCSTLIQDLEEVIHSRDGGIKKTYNRSDPYSSLTHASDALGYWVSTTVPTIMDSINSPRCSVPINIPIPFYGNRKTAVL